MLPLRADDVQVDIILGGSWIIPSWRGASGWTARAEAANLRPVRNLYGTFAKAMSAGSQIWGSPLWSAARLWW